MKKFLFFINLSLFLVVWLAITVYTLFAILNPEIEYTNSHFWIFIFILDLLALPLLWLWWKIGSKSVTHKTWVFMFTLIIILWWGVFTFYSLLSLHLNDFQFRWLAFVYIWEVVVVGGIGAYIVVRIASFSDKPFKGSKITPQDHVSISGIPLRASLSFFGIVIFGYSIGSIQLSYFSALPFSEIAKNLTSGIVTGAVGSLFVFLVLERFIDPILKKSGLVLNSQELLKARRPLSLFVKIYGITATLVLTSVIFFMTMSYGRGQAILENDLKVRLENEMELAANMYKYEFGKILAGDELKKRLGDNGEFSLLTLEDPDDQSFIKEVKVFRDGKVRIVEYLPVDNSLNYFKGIIYEDDFDQGLDTLLVFSLLLFIIILLIVSVAGTLFARSIMVPIQEIKAGAIRIGMGNFSEPVAVFTYDELEEISLALNRASEELRLSYLRLEDEIEERTKQVFEANKKMKEQIRELDTVAKRLVKRDFELHELNQKLREIDESKTHFVSIAAHQLRTPLSAIKWTLHMLLAGDLGKIPKKQRVIVDQASQSTDRLINLVGDLLNVARIESGQIKYKFEPFSIEKLMDDLIANVAQKIKEKGLSFEFKKSEKPLSESAGDKDKLLLAILGIVENSIDYTEKGGKISIAVSKKDDKNYQIVISDTGMGIPKNQHEMLFQKFFRADNVVRRQIPGTGLALYITRRIIEAHGGTISFESEEGKGSTFFISLPFLK